MNDVGQGSKRVKRVRGFRGLEGNVLGKLKPPLVFSFKALFCINLDIIT